MSLRIAIISYHTCPLAPFGDRYTGGMNVYIRELARVLGILGFHVDVFTRSEDPRVPMISHDLGYGQRVIHVPAGPQRPLPKSLWPRYIPEFVERVQAIVQAHRWRYHVIHSHYWLSGLVAERLREAWGIPWVHMFHTLQALKPPALRDEEIPEREAEERRLARAADCILCATHDEAMFLHWHYGVPWPNLVVLPPGVDTTRFYPIPQEEARAYVGLPREHKVVLYVGRLDPIKGLDVLLKAMAHLKAAGALSEAEACLILLGGPVDAENAVWQELQALREAYNLHNLVAFIGPRTREVLPYYYAAADVVVLPSHYESFGLTVLEAMACGRPVVASQVGGLASLVRHGETGFLIPPQDPNALAGYLALLLQDVRLRKRLGRCGVRYARRYAWPRIARRIARLYTRLVQAQRTARAGCREDVR